MFWSTMCPSSGELIVSIRYLVYVTHLYRVTYTRCRIDTINSPDDGQMAARNMQRIEINIHEKELCVRLVIYQRLGRVYSKKGTNTSRIPSLLFKKQNILYLLALLFARSFDLYSAIITEIFRIQHGYPTCNLAGRNQPAAISVQKSHKYNKNCKIIQTVRKSTQLNLPFSLILRSVHLQLVTDVSIQPIGPIASKNLKTVPTVCSDDWTRLVVPKRRETNCQSTLRNIPEERSCNLHAYFLLFHVGPTNQPAIRWTPRGATWKMTVGYKFVS